LENRSFGGSGGFLEVPGDCREVLKASGEDPAIENKETKVIYANTADL